MRRTLPLLVVLAACGGPSHPVESCGALGCQVTVDRFVVAAPPALDLLIVVGTATTTPAARAALGDGLDRMTAALTLRHADLHVGFIASDLGAGAFTPPGCGTPGGDGGRLQNAPLGPTCDTARLVDDADRYLAWAPGPAGGVPRTNFTGALADALACYAAIPAGGCAFEHLLAAFGDALDGCLVPGGCTVSENEGFLRPSARLALLLLTQGDDCSAADDTTLFDPADAAAATLGPLGIYRCFEYGVVCGGADPGRQAGPRSGCVPGDADPDPRHELGPIEFYAAFLQTLKASPDDVDLTVVAGPASPVGVVLDGSGAPALAPSCVGALGAATPAIRLGALVELFAVDDARLVTVCQADLPGALEVVGTKLAGAPPSAATCLAAPLADRDPAAPGLQPWCAVGERPAGSAAPFADVPPCDPILCDPAGGLDCACAPHALPAGAAGCWYLWPDDVGCGAATGRAGSGLRLRIDRGAYAACDPVLPEAATEVLVECATCPGDGAPGTSDCSAGCAWNWPAACADADGGG